MPDNRIAAFEAILFVHGEPLPYSKIEEALALEKGEAKLLADELAEKLSNDGSRGLEVIRDGEKVQLATKPEFGNFLEGFVKEEITEDLTPASLETLSIVAYLGPISRAKIEYLRGVNSSMILRSLSVRGLVERLPDPEHPSGFLYRTTLDLMKHLGIASAKDLPEHGKFKALLKVFEDNQKNEQQQG